jgi:hypothetical protein
VTISVSRGACWLFGSLIVQCCFFFLSNCCLKSSSWWCTTRTRIRLCIMQHEIQLWGGSALRAVFVEQKRLVRCLAGVRYWPGQEPLCTCRTLFACLNLLPVYLIYLFECCKFVRLLPAYQGIRATKLICKWVQISRMNPAVCVSQPSIMLSLKRFMPFKVIRDMCPCWKNLFTWKSITLMMSSLMFEFCY